MDTATANGQTASELDQRIWSVISFDRREGTGLTYAEAAAKLAELDSQGIAGLSIVTDNAARLVDADLPAPA